MEKIKTQTIYKRITILLFLLSLLLPLTDIILGYTGLPVFNKTRFIFVVFIILFLAIAISFFNKMKSFSVESFLIGLSISYTFFRGYYNFDLEINSIFNLSVLISALLYLILTIRLPIRDN